MTAAVDSQWQVKFEKGLVRDYLREKGQVYLGGVPVGGGTAAFE